MCFWRETKSVSKKHQSCLLFFKIFKLKLHLKSLETFLRRLIVRKLIKLQDNKLYRFIWKYSEEDKKKLIKQGKLKTIVIINESVSSNGANIKFEGDASKDFEEEINIADI